MVKYFWVFMLMVFINHTAQSSDWVQSTGSEIKVPEKGFSITPPQGWNYRFNHFGTSFLAEDPIKVKEKFKRTISVRRFAAPVYIDQATAEQFMQTIPKKMSAARADIESYHMRNYQITVLANGHGAILFYAGYKVNGFELMEAHILTSSKQHSYLATYSDLEEHIEGENGSTEHLNTAWASLVSLNTDSKPPGYRYLWLIQLLIILSAILVVTGWMYWKKRKSDKFLASERGLEQEESHLSMIKTHEQIIIEEGGDDEEGKTHIESYMDDGDSPYK